MSRVWLLKLFLALLMPLERDSLLTFIEGPKDSLFGYAVTFHLENNTTSLLVGAPKSETLQIKYGVTSPGAVYTCNITNNNNCRQIAFDRTGNNVDLGLPVDDKSNQWFGASMTSSGSNGVVVREKSKNACAPRYIFYSSNSKRKEPVGTCFIAKNGFTEFSEHSPCRTRLWGYHKEGYCQAGFSSTAHEETFFIGAVGTSYWQGQVFSKGLNGIQGRHWNNWNESNDNQYLGYSLATGTFFPERKGAGVDIVVSAPRAARLKGKVYILSPENSEVLYSFTGEQIGSYFGHSLEVGDFNGDGRDDLIIGAPLFSSSSGGKFENGRAYLVFRESQGLFKHWRIIDGLGHRGRFGFASANLGDLNSDGIQDFAISSPYDGNGDNLQGKVFVFLGKRDTEEEYRPSRVLSPGSLQMKIRSFGFSLHGLKGSNGIKARLAIGAPLSDAVFLSG